MRRESTGGLSCGNFFLSFLCGGGGGGCGGSGSDIPMDTISITCMPGKLFKGKTEEEKKQNHMWHHFPICAYTGKMYVQDLEMVNASMLVKGVPDTKMESDRPIEYRKKIRWSYNIARGMKFDLTCTQQSKRSIQDAESALKIYEVEFEIDFQQLTHAERNTLNYRPLLEKFVEGVTKLLYTEE